MTDKTEAQPEALRLAAEFEDCARIDAIPSINDVKKSAAELRRQHAEIQQLKAEKSEMAALNYENYEFQRKKADAATATVYRFHYAMKDAGWHPGRTDDDLTDIIRAKGRELAQLSARQAAPDGWRLVPVLPTDAMLLTLASDGEAEVIAKHPEWHPMLLDRSGVPQRYAAMLSAAPPPPEREPLTLAQIDGIGDATGKPSFTWHYEFARAIERAHGIGATND